MKLPFVELKKIPQIKAERHIIYLRQKNNLNNLIIPNNSISSVLSNNNKNNLGTLTQNYHKTQRNINELLYKKGKTLEKIKTKKFFLNNNISIINNNISTNKTNVYENNNAEYINKNEFIKNPFDSFKIRKEISSYIFSSPENQIRFINNIMMNKSDNKINDENNINNKIILPGNIKRKSKIKLMKDVKEKDEDKINFKESSLFSLFFGNKYKNGIEKNIRKNKIKSIESWDNNLLKNILPQNIKNYNEYNYQNIDNNNNCEFNFRKKRNKVGYYRNNEYQTLNSFNNNKNKTKYDFEGNYKKINMILVNKDKHDNKYKIKKNKKLERSSSICKFTNYIFL